MNTDVVGRVRNVQLPTSKPLLPLFEAIMNSIHAIEDAKISDGRIEIEVVRDPGNLFTELERAYADISGFVVTDNGIGFDEHNFEAFSTSDTTYKASRGGKGIGRFMWLAAFESVQIDSVFGFDGDAKRRSFTFRMRGSGIENVRTSAETGLERITSVRLIGFKEKYRAQCPKRLETIAAFIIEEFLEDFVGSHCPVIILRDRADGESIPLGYFFDQQMSPNIVIGKFETGGSKFEVLHVRLYSTHIAEHRLCLCAHGRVVIQEKLIGRIPNLLRHLQDEHNEEFTYAAYVNSPALDAGVNADRTAFNISEDRSGLIPSEITLSEMREAILGECKRFLNPYTAPVAEQNVPECRNSLSQTERYIDLS